MGKLYIMPNDFAYASLPAVFYLVHISIRAASYPLDQLEVLLRIPPGQVDTGVHCFQSSMADEPRRSLKTDIFKKSIRRQKSQPESNVAPTWLPLRTRACAVDFMLFPSLWCLSKGRGL